MFGVAKATGIIGHWPLNGEYVVGTTARDKSRSGNDGVITVGGGGLTTGIHSEVDGSYEFDGTDTKINTGTDMIGVRPLTIGLWINTNFSGENRYEFIVDNGKTRMFFDDDNDRILFTSDGISHGISLLNSITINTWHHICVTRTAAGVANICINGVLSGAANQDSGVPVAGTTNVIIGNNNITSRSFSGKIAEVISFSYIMSAGQVANLYQSYGRIAA